MGFDNKGNLRIGNGGRLSNGRIVVDFEADDTAGIALDATPPVLGSTVRVGIKLGNFYLVQDTANDGTADFGIIDSSGNVLLSVLQGTSNVDAWLPYVNALADSAVPHAQAVYGLSYADFATWLTSVADIATDATAWTIANTFKTAAAAHLVSVGTPYVKGAHKAADTALRATLVAVPAATNAATLCTLVNAISTALTSHGDSAGVHFHDDATLAGYTPTSDLLAGNATQGNAEVELEALMTAYFTHLLEAAAA